jgi:serine/threonine protein kinase/formylglycine-generating enzyme required for sulfatase activity
MVGAYRVVRFLGAGGMGAVYEVEHGMMRTRHAMKVLGEAYRHSAQVRERFTREAQLMFALGAHPNIVRATDIVDHDETLGLVIDLVDGGDLGEALEARPGPLPWGEVWRILKPVVSAVAFAHAQQVVHRDLKPDNVLLRRDGSWPGVPMVADFGIAKVIGTESATRTQSRMGTAAYGAPEQFRNAKEVGPEADVWGLAMLVWRLVRGGLPVDPEDNLAVIKLYEGLTPVPRLVGVPEGVAHAVAAALNIDPSQRPRDAGVFGKLLAAEDTEHFTAPADGHRVPLRAVPDSPRETPSEAPSETKKPAGAGEARVAANQSAPPDEVDRQLSGAVLSKARTEAPPAPSRSGRLWLSVALVLFVLSGIGYGISRRPPAELAEQPAPAPVEPEPAPNAEVAQLPSPVPAPSAPPEVVAEPSEVAEAPDGFDEPPLGLEDTLDAPDVLAPELGPPVLEPFPQRFVRTEPGFFPMGSPPYEEGRGEDETQREVTLTIPAWVGRYEVTQGEWEAVLGTRPSFFANCGRECPVENVTWYEAVEFANARSRRENLEECYQNGRFKGLRCLGYRLPTEAEWEYVARAGVAEARFGRVEGIGWFAGNSGGVTHPVALKRRNAFGLRDMFGNVAEWTNDWYGVDGVEGEDPVGPLFGTERVIRGGAFNAGPEALRAAARERAEPGFRSERIGLRLARTAAMKPPEVIERAFDETAGLTPGDDRYSEPLPGRRNGKVVLTQGLLIVHGGMKRDTVRDRIDLQLSGLGRCYAAVIAVRPNVAGEVTLGFEIVSDGTTRSVGLTASTLGHADLEKCIRDTVWQWQFPPPPNGATARVRQKIGLRNGGG